MADSVAFLFPGQGAQYVGMARDIYEGDPRSRELFAGAEEATGLSITQVMFEGPEETLNTTDHTQVAMTLASLAAAFYLKDQGVYPAAVAGFSVGEYAALVTAGVIRSEDVFDLVRARGEITERASRTHDSDAGRAGMAACIGLPFEKVADALEGNDGAYAAIHNSPVQTVIAGTAAGLARAEESVKAAGAKRFIKLKVSGPFHSPLLTEARDEFAEYLSDVEFADPILPVYSNVTGEQVDSGDRARELCLEQLVSPVRWVDEQRSLLAGGVRSFLEVGPGTVLGGLFKALKKQDGQIDGECLPAGTVENINKLLQTG
jgi:[acyl-carrier-protein] S-malonyltransferase